MAEYRSSASSRGRSNISQAEAHAVQRALQGRTGLLSGSGAPAGSGKGTALIVLALLLVAPVLALYRLCDTGGADARTVCVVAAILSLLAFVIVRSDKKFAQQNAWRIPERLLHGLEFFGGWPGSFLAQRLYRHKVSKRSYQIVFWLIVIIYQFVAIDYLLGWKLLNALGWQLG